MLFTSTSASHRPKRAPPAPAARARDIYSPSKPSGDEEVGRGRGLSPGEGVETLQSWRKRQERKLLQVWLG